jgi:hypothetical protein
VHPVILFGDYNAIVRDIADAAAGVVSERLRTDLLSLHTRTERLVATTDELLIAAQNISDQASEHRSVVDQAIELIKSLGVQDPRLDQVLAQLTDTAEQIDQATTDLASATDTEPEPQEPTEPVEPAEPEQPVS